MPGGMCLMDNRPIGVFDSGLGGLTAVKEIKKVMPNESIIYFGDTGRVPYGTRSKTTLLKYAHQDINFLLSYNVKAIVAACGTISSTASEVGNNLSIPFIDVIYPTSIAACKETKNNRIGVIATSATINSGSFKRRINSINPDIVVLSKACPLFVSLVENGFILPHDPVTTQVAEKYLSELKNMDIDTLILGCTHFPIISHIIKDVIGTHVSLIDSGKETAKFCYETLKAKELLSDKKSAKYTYCVSDETDEFTNVAKIFLGSEIDGDVEKVDIEKY
jgi:glutamate racemase